MNTLEEICRYLKIPSLPKKKFDKDSPKSFKNGIAKVKMFDDTISYAVCTFDVDKDKAPRVVKTFDTMPFKSILDVFVIPSYLDQIDYDTADLDNESKEKMKWLEEEANELENEDVVNDNDKPKSEYYFDNIHNDQEAMAFIKSYNKTNKIRGHVPSTHDGIMMRLSVIYSEIKNRT